jgi:hypothetical protein
VFYKTETTTCFNAMKTLALLAMAGACCLGARAAEPAWNNGHVTLRSGEVIAAPMSYNWKAEVLQVRMPNGTRRAYSAHRVDSFCYYDSIQNVLRKFSTLEMPVSSAMIRPVFAEECAVGYYTVYRRLRHTKELFKIVSPSLYDSDHELVKDSDNFDYFVVDVDGLTTGLNQFHEKLWPQMLTDYKVPLKQCVMTRQLDPHSTVGRLILINQYNYLTEHAPTRANRPTIGSAGN